MGDVNSLQFDSNGAVTALTTTHHAVAITTESGERRLYAPSEKESLCNEAVAITVPLRIDFTDGRIRFNKRASDEYDLAACSFDIVPYDRKAADPAYECGS